MRTARAAKLLRRIAVIRGVTAAAAAAAGGHPLAARRQLGEHALRPAGQVGRGVVREQRVLGELRRWEEGGG